MTIYTVCKISVQPQLFILMTIILVQNLTVFSATHVILWGGSLEVISSVLITSFSDKDFVRWTRWS